MYGSTLRRPGRSAKAYADIALETRVMSASPAQLITLLFEGADAALVKAKAHLIQGQTAQRGQAFSKAIDIIDSGLKSSLDMEAGGELSKNLAQTYDLIIQHLMMANLEADLDRLEIAQKMLANISAGWQQNLANLASTQPS
ncbi:flagellar export chaperone FliS [Pusillimonas sp. CC-YST705]|uniref:Flagellar secretion chaperone FliS n=1 Tax=Mesopusillimonas faecipullorum TaxID=2755040 RepID=A0ABS8C9Y7_9BURK|nr:flagellar export chaperone FliS [Mesopusillimonas faecipullorum]MCB5362842.1 flagellar export chaperone FliS [Mesopusillimonas faecipullorum]